MAAFSKTDIAFIRSQFNRLDRENFGSLDVPAIKRAVEYCWVVAGLKDKPQPQEIESAFQAHQQNQRVNLSQFILVGKHSYAYAVFSWMYMHDMSTFTYCRFCSC